MNKICTTIEQSKKLIELGIDVNTADMYYQYFKSYSSSNGVTTGYCDIPIIGSWKKYHISIPDPAMPNADIPAWSLSALLAILPFHIISNNQRYAFGIFKGFNKEGETYMLRYNVFNTEIILYETDYYSNPLDAAFEMIVWLKENKKL